METRLIYHGSNVIVTKPRILTNGFYKDFGYGFYCTNLERQAKRWAITKRNHHIVNCYEFREDSALSVLRFPEMNEEWLDFIVACRRGIEHGYDIVEGAMADDTIWDYVESFAAGEISRKAFWALVEFRYPTHQIVFTSPKALECLTYQRSDSL